MRYVKVLGLKKYLGLYDRENNTILVDFGHGILRAVLTSFHEVVHKTIDVFGVVDTLDFFDHIFQTIIMKGRVPPLKLFGPEEVIYFDRSGNPYRMIKVKGKWERIEFDPWQLEEMKMKEEKE